MNRKNFLVVIITTFSSIAYFSTIANAEAFQTPSKNTACIWGRDGIRCDTMDNTAKKPPRPKDCGDDIGGGDYEAVASLSPHGKGKVWGCVTDSARVQDFIILQYGSKLSLYGITCTSRRTGLTCINLDKRGWEISKERRRSF
jgi:hypothetical protein